MLYFFYFPLKVAGGNPQPLPLNDSPDSWQNRNDCEDLGLLADITGYLSCIPTCTLFHIFVAPPPLPGLLQFQSYHWFNFYLSLFSGMLMYDYE